MKALALKAFVGLEGLALEGLGLEGPVLRSFGLLLPTSLTALLAGNLEYGNVPSTRFPLNEELNFAPGFRIMALRIFGDFRARQPTKNKNLILEHWSLVNAPK